MDCQIQGCLNICNRSTKTAYRVPNNLVYSCISFRVPSYNRCPVVTTYTYQVAFAATIITHALPRHPSLVLARPVHGDLDGLDVPDVARVVGDGAVGGELAGAGGGEDAHARPALLVLERRIHAVLRVQVAREVVGQQIVVAAVLPVDRLADGRKKVRPPEPALPQQPAEKTTRGGLRCGMFILQKTTECSCRNLWESFACNRHSCCLNNRQS